MWEAFRRESVRSNWLVFIDGRNVSFQIQRNAYVWSLCPFHSSCLPRQNKVHIPAYVLEPGYHFRCHKDSMEIQHLVLSYPEQGPAKFSKITDTARRTWALALPFIVRGNSCATWKAQTIVNCSAGEISHYSIFQYPITSTKELGQLWRYLFTYVSSV